MRIYTILLLNLVFMTIHAQTHEWAKSIRSSYGRSSTAFTLSGDSKNNVYIVGECNDSLFVDSQQVTVGITPGPFDAYFAKLNSKGKLEWCKILYTDTTRGVLLRHVQVITDNKIAIYGLLFGNTVKFTTTDSISSSINKGTIGFVAFYDSSGKFLSSVKSFSGLGFMAIWNGPQFFNGEMVFDSKENCYLSFYKAKFIGSLSSKTGSIALNDSLARFIIVKYSKNLDSILWYKDLPELTNFLVNRIRIDDDDNLYAACLVGGKDFTLGNKIYKYRNYTDKGFFTILSPNGNFLKGMLINSDSTQSDNILDIGAIDTNTIYVTGYVNDSILFKNKWYSSTNKAAKKFSYKVFPYVGVISISQGAKWFQMPKTRVSLASFNQLNLHPIGRLTFDRQGFVYVLFGGCDSITTIGGLTSEYHSNYVFVKLDKIGNALWIKPFRDKIRDMISTTDSNLVYTGPIPFNQDIFLDPFMFKKNLGTTFIAKTKDYSIIRENVSPGPYCAGDTFTIPYYRFGEYDTSNHFIAELSDEKGNFDGNERELGRLKTTQNGVISCTIPLFKVFTSPNYRIRIRSTSPPVQSFYKRDTLQLLIYSKDKADPGLTESICQGDTLKLNTYGGTRWTWSPNYNISNPNARQPLVWPSKDTIYQIIIGDSSGCGDPDTAYKKVLLRPALNASLNFRDSSVCSNAPINLIVNFSGGDTSGYAHKWYYIYSPILWFPLTKGAGVLNDTFTYTPTNTTEKLAVILTDGCTKMNDTAFLTLNLRSKLNITPLISDTILCNGNKAKFKGNASGGVSKFYHWVWKDISKNTILSNYDTLLIVANQTTKIQLIVNDGCDELADTNEFTVFVNPPLKGAILYNKGSLHDTTLCFGKNLKFYSAGKGGLGSGYNFKWYLDNTLLSSIDTLNFLTTNLYSSNGGSKALKLVLKDNCTSGSDSIARTIKVIPGPQTDFSWGKTCNKTKIPFTFTGSLAALPITTKYSWHYPDGDSSTVQNPLKLLSKVGKNQVSLILRSSNGCKDALTKEVDVKQEAIAGFTADDVCEDSAVKFMNTSQDGINYDWRFGDGGNSNIESPEHLYLISGITKTYNVSLIAIVPNGCSDTITNAVTINANPKSDFNFSSSGTQVNFTALETSASNYQWIFGDGGTASTTNRNTQYNYSKFPSGKYTACLKVSNLAGCTSETCKEINISGASNSIIKQEGIKIYPNPNQGIFALEMVEPNGSVTIEIYDPIGKMVYQIESNQSYTLLEPKLDNGIYILRVIINNQIFTQKILVQK